MYEIEKGVPLPAFSVNRETYPWRAMKVGDSFFVQEAGNKEVAAVRRAAGMFGKRNNMKFATRLLDDGLRVWRVE